MRGTTPSGTPRTDEQKACRKLVITTGMRVGRHASMVLFLALSSAIAGLYFGGSVRIAGLIIGTTLLLVALPMLATGKRLAGTDGHLLAAIDEPERVEMIHIDATPRGNRYTFALRDVDGNVNHILLLAEEIATLKAYFESSLPSLAIATSERAVKTIRQRAA